jgi:hypothetical protein
MHVPFLRNATPQQFGLQQLNAGKPQGQTTVSLCANINRGLSYLACREQLCVADDSEFILK